MFAFFHHETLLKSASSVFRLNETPSEVRTPLPNPLKPRNQIIDLIMLNLTPDKESAC